MWNPVQSSLLFLQLILILLVILTVKVQVMQREAIWISSLNEGRVEEKETRKIMDGEVEGNEHYKTFILDYSVYMCLTWRVIAVI